MTPQRKKVAFSAAVAPNGEISEPSSSIISTVNFKYAHVAEKARPDFPILSRQLPNNRSLVYLDSAATSQKPQAVLDVLNEYYLSQNSNVHRGAHTLSREATEAYEAARDKVANFIGAKSRNEIIFTGGATESINLVVQTYIRQNLKEGNEIITTECEHHANIVPYQMIAEELGLKVRYVRLNPETGLPNWDELDELLNEKTRFVAFAHVSNTLGGINPVHELVEKIRKYDCRILLDSCQSVPHMQVDVQKLNVDFLVASGHKMCAPTGIGFLWAPEDLLNTMPPYRGGGEMIERVTLEGTTWQPAPARFEAGTPAIAQAIGLGAAIDYIQSIGMDQVEAYEAELAEYLYEQLQTVDGLRILGPSEHRVALACFSHPSVHPSDLGSFLDMEGVAVRAGHHCCQPLHTAVGLSHSARASLAFYNTKEEVDALVHHLKETIAYFENLESSDGEDDFVPFV